MNLSLGLTALQEILREARGHKRIWPYISTERGDLKSNPSMNTNAIGPISRTLRLNILLLEILSMQVSLRPKPPSLLGGFNSSCPNANSSQRFNTEIAEASEILLMFCGNAQGSLCTELAQQSLHLNSQNIA